MSVLVVFDPRTVPLTVLVCPPPRDLSREGNIIVAEPFRDLFERPILLTKSDNRIVKELLVL